MKRTLHDLLVAAGLDGKAPREIPDDAILILENYGAVPPAVQKSGYYVWNRGFNFVVLGRDGAPDYFCKCRPTADANLERETAVLQALNRDPELRGVVPWVSGARDGEVQLQLSEFLPGSPYEQAVPRLTERAWVESLTQILGVARTVSTRATNLLPALLTAPVSLHVAAANALTQLGGAGVAADVLESIDRALAGAGSLPPLLQHGDLWPGNVLWHRGSWRLLDFETFGIVQTPLYDVCHFVRNCWSLREPRAAATTTWMARLPSGAQDAELCRRIMLREARQLQLTPVQATGVLLYYVVDVTAQLIRRGAPQVAWAPLIREVLAAADLLRGGAALEQAVFLEPL
jgi:aminoglycoside phosphotransferase (APT) family kinase protein